MKGQQREAALAGDLGVTQQRGTHVFKDLGLTFRQQRASSEQGLGCEGDVQRDHLGSENNEQETLQAYRGEFGELLQQP